MYNPITVYMYMYMQLVADMGRLVDDDKLKLSSVQDLAPQIIAQARIDSAHNSRLRSALQNKDTTDTGTWCMYDQPHSQAV